MSGVDPAFPRNQVTETPGLSKRELFAAMAMQGRLSSFVPEDGPIVPEGLAKFSIHCADALLAELSPIKRPTRSGE